MTKHIDQQDADTDTYGAVGYVEGRPVISADMDVQKVNHFAEPKSIDHIAHCTGHDERKACSYPFASLVHRSIQIPENSHRHTGNNQEEHGTNGCCLAGKKPEGTSRISNVGQRKKTGNHRKTFTEGQSVQHKLFGHLIDENQDTGKYNETYVSIHKQIFSV